MVSPVQFNNCQRVYFRGEKDDLINAPGKFEQPAVPETPADDVTLSTQEVEEKSSAGKTIAKVVGTIVVAAAALFGAYKWKGDTWLNKEAKGFWPKLKNWLMKPGEYMEKGYNKLRGKGKVKDETKTEVKDETKTEVKDETKTEVKDKTKTEVKDETKTEVKDETKTEQK